MSVSDECVIHQAPGTCNPSICSRRDQAPSELEAIHYCCTARSGAGQDNRCKHSAQGQLGTARHGMARLGLNIHADGAYCSSETHHGHSPSVIKGYSGGVSFPRSAILLEPAITSPRSSCFLYHVAQCKNKPTLKRCGAGDSFSSSTLLTAPNQMARKNMQALARILVQSCESAPRPSSNPEEVRSAGTRAKSIRD